MILFYNVRYFFSRWCYYDDDCYDNSLCLGELDLGGELFFIYYCVIGYDDFGDYEGY